MSDGAVCRWASNSEPDGKERPLEPHGDASMVIWWGWKHINANAETMTTELNQSTFLLVLGVKALGISLGEI